MSGQSIYTAARGLQAQQTRLENIGNNLANVSTIGYKSVRVDFKEALYQTLTSPAGGGNLQRGHGVLTSATKRSFSQGSVVETGSQTDFYVFGEAYFAVADKEGTVRYTRDGAFALSVENGTPYLVTAQGHHVLDTQGAPIAMQGNLSRMTVSENGVMQFVDEAGEPIGQAELGLFSFPNSQGLLSAGNNLLVSGDVSDEAQPAVGARIQQGAREASNVDLATELTRLIRTQRAFSLASKALQTADEMEARANQLRG